MCASWRRIAIITRIGAGKFKDRRLKILGEVALTRRPIVVTKRGRPVATIVPYSGAKKSSASLAGSILKERGDPFGTGANWDEGRS